MESAPVIQWIEVPCAFCGATSTVFFDHEGWRWPTQYVRCRRCGLIYLQPRPQLDEAYLRKAYDEPPPFLVRRYEVGPDFSLRDVCPKDRQLFEDTLAVMLAAHPAPGLLVDVGAGNGILLALAKERGWQTLGTEISEQKARFCLEHFGVEVRVGTLASLQLPAETVSAVTIRHVLEHLDDPPAWIQESHRVLKRAGILLLEVPNPVSWEKQPGRIWRRLTGWKRRSLKDELPQHLFGFPPRTLAIKTCAFGFELLSCGTYSTPGRHGALTLLLLRAYHKLGVGTKTRLVFRKI